MAIDLKRHVREIWDFPSKGILFRDITTLLRDGEILKETINQMEDRLRDVSFSKIAGPESRGFIFSMPIAYAFGAGFVPVRKSGKLPAPAAKCAYDLEYGSAEIEIHKDAIAPGDKVILVDDLLATGGTCKAACELIESLGGEVVALLFLIELAELKGRELLKGRDVRSVLVY